jgi:hypothetical protein
MRTHGIWAISEPVRVDEPGLLKRLPAAVDAGPLQVEKLRRLRVGAALRPRLQQRQVADCLVQRARGGILGASARGVRGLRRAAGERESVINIGHWLLKFPKCRSLPTCHVRSCRATFRVPLPGGSMSVAQPPSSATLGLHHQLSAERVLARVLLDTEALTTSKTCPALSHRRPPGRAEGGTARCHRGERQRSRRCPFPP